MTIHFPYDTLLMGGQRPAGHPEHLPYICMNTGAVCIDKLPITNDEIRECAAALEKLNKP